MAYIPVSRTIATRFGGEANLRMAVSKAVSGPEVQDESDDLPIVPVAFLEKDTKDKSVF